MKTLKPPNQHPDFGKVCEHGQLKRQCDRCDDAETIAWLESRIAALRTGLQRVGVTRASGADFPLCDACGNLTCNCPEACGGHVARATLLADDDKAGA